MKEVFCALTALAKEARSYVKSYEADREHAARVFCQGCYGTPALLDDETTRAEALLARIAELEKP